MSVNPDRPSPSLKARRASVQVGRTIGNALEFSDLTVASYRVLAYLSTGNLAAKVLAAKLAVSRPAVTAAVDWLEARGYVTRIQSWDDKRSVDIQITPKGQAALDEADDLVAERLSTVLSSLSNEEADTVLQALELLYDAVTRYREFGYEVGDDATSQPSAADPELTE